MGKLFPLHFAKVEQSLEPQHSEREGGGSGRISVGENCLENPATIRLNQTSLYLLLLLLLLSLQPSLSMDGNTVETLLIKNEGDFISVEQGKELNAHARKRHSQQLPHPPHASQLHQQQQQLHGGVGGGGGGGHAYATDKQHKRDENMRQLLDVTNTLTIEELRDFEMR